MLPAGGSFLCANSAGYSLSGHPFGAADGTFTTDLPDNAGIALFNNNTGGGDFNPATRLDAAGSTSEANPLYKEGAGYPALTPFSIDYAFARDRCGKQGSITTNGSCASPGAPLDTNNNAADFIFVDTNGTSAGAGQRLGASGPANLAAPVGAGNTFTTALLDDCSADNAGPNAVRDITSNPAGNATFGTIELRRTFTNTSGAPITSLRFRIIDLTTFPAPTGYADLRPRTVGSTSVTVDRTPCGGGTSSVTVAGTTLEQPPQPNGGGFNSMLSVPSVTAGAPLAPGASIDLRFLLGLQQTGMVRFAVVAEGSPTGGGVFEYQSCSDSGACAPMVTSIVRAGASPAGGSTVSYTVTFDQSVTGVDTADFVLTASGVTGATIASISGSGATYTVVVNTGTGNGTLGLNLVDNDSIQNAGSARLGGTGAGNGNFTGQVYTINPAPPAAVPTMTEWAMILFGTILAGGAALHIQRRRRFA